MYALYPCCHSSSIFWTCEEDQERKRNDEELLMLIFKLKSTAEYSRGLYMEVKAD